MVIKHILIALACIFTIQATCQEKTNSQSIEWLSWEQAMEKHQEVPKKWFVDVYTDWCGWCKKMDKTTFQNKEVVKALNDGFYAIKFDAEQKGAIEFSGNTFQFVPGGRRGGVHELAMALLDNQMGYPSFVLLDENFARIMISPGFKQAPSVLKELEYAREEIYKTTSWEDFNK